MHEIIRIPEHQAKAMLREVSLIESFDAKIDKLRDKGYIGNHRCCSADPRDVHVC